MRKRLFLFVVLLVFSVSKFSVYPAFLSCDENQKGTIEVDFQLSLSEIHPSLLTGKINLKFKKHEKGKVP